MANHFRSVMNFRLQLLLKLNNKKKIATPMIECNSRVPSKKQLSQSVFTSFSYFTNQSLQNSKTQQLGLPLFQNHYVFIVLANIESSKKGLRAELCRFFRYNFHIPSYQYGNGNRINSIGFSTRGTLISAFSIHGF